MLLLLLLLLFAVKVVVGADPKVDVEVEAVVAIVVVEGDVVLNPVDVVLCRLCLLVCVFCLCALWVWGRTVFAELDRDLKHDIIVEQQTTLYYQSQISINNSDI